MKLLTFNPGTTYTFEYKNHRGEVAIRTARYLFLEYNDNPGYEYTPGWFIHCYDWDKKADRSFALTNITDIKAL